LQEWGIVAILSVVSVIAANITMRFFRK